MTDDLQDDEDLIGQMTAEPEPSPSGSDIKMVEDVVSVMDAIQTAHGKHCAADQFYTNKFGQVYCLACGSNVGSVCDISDAFCPKCGCANSAHMNGKCLMQGCPCNDAHEFTESNWTRQQKEAKQWLEKRQAKRR